MITKLYIPYIDTEKINYTSDIDLTDDMLGELSMQKLNQTNDALNNMMYNNVKDSRYAVQDDVDSSEKYNECECEAFIQNANHDEIDENFFSEYLTNGKMFVIILNVNPLSLDGNGESELKFWIDDSRKVHEDDIDDITKLRILPVMNIGILLNGEKHWMHNCKLVENMSDAKFPINIAIICEKIV